MTSSTSKKAHLSAKPDIIKQLGLLSDDSGGGSTSAEEIADDDDEALLRQSTTDDNVDRMISRRVSIGSSDRSDREIEGDTYIHELEPDGIIREDTPAGEPVEIDESRQNRACLTCSVNIVRPSLLLLLRGLTV